MHPTRLRSEDAIGEGHGVGAGDQENQPSFRELRRSEEVRSCGSQFPEPSGHQIAFFISKASALRIETAFSTDACTVPAACVRPPWYNR